MDGPGVKYRLGPGRPVNNCRWASLKSMLCLAKTERNSMRWTTLSFKQLAAQKTLRMDPKYWIKKKSAERQASSDRRKRQAASSSLTDPAVQDKIGQNRKE